MKGFHVYEQKFVERGAEVYRRFQGLKKCKKGGNSVDEIVKLF